MKMQKPEKNVKIKNQNKSKFVYLNFNLKYEIIAFLPIAQQFNQATQLNKRFNSFLNKKRIFSFLKCEAKNLIKNLNFTVKYISLAKVYLLSALTECSEEKINEIINFLLKIKHKNLTQLDLTEIKSLDNYFLSSFLAKSETLQHLFLFENKLGKRAEDLKFLCLALAENKSITDLFVSQNKVGKNASDMAFVNLMLLLNTKLTYVDLSYNNIGCNKEDGKFLASALKRNKTLKSLNLCSNKIGATNKDEFLLLCAAMLENNSLESVDLSFNFVENNEANADAFLTLIRLNLNFRFFSLLKNPLAKNEKLVKLKESGFDGRFLL